MTDEVGLEIVVTPIQLAAILENETIEESSTGAARAIAIRRGAISLAAEEAAARRRQ